MTAPVLETNADDALSEKIAMTAPVLIHAGGGDNEGDNRVMQFVMPSKYTSLDELPKPKDPRVVLRELPERFMAVKQF